MIERHSLYDDILHEAVVHDGRVYLGGIIADDLSLDMAGQARDVLAQLDALLRANGSDRDHVISVQIFFADLAERDAFNAAWKEYFAVPSLPARAGVGAMLGPGVKVELTAVAAQRAKRPA